MQAQPAPPVEIRTIERGAEQVFDPALVADSRSTLYAASDNLLLLSQAIAAVVVVAGLIASARKDHVQMEGIATMILQVAFIAIVPTLRIQTLETADAAAGALGYHAAAGPGGGAPAATSLWGLLGEWAPPGSPYLDALETQAAERPDSGREEEWGLRAWNWARGVGTSTASAFDAAWQSTSGGMRAGFVFAGCGGAACVTACTITLTYLAEILRYVLFIIGCAGLPVFIAALGVDTLRPLAMRYIVFLVSIACWPIGWALTNGVTVVMVHGLCTWMDSATTAALALGSAGAVPPLAVAAPYIGWGGLIVFGGGTIAICLWVAGTVLVVPLAIGRLVSVGGGFVASAVGLGGGVAGISCLRGDAHAAMRRPTWEATRPGWRTGAPGQAYAPDRGVPAGRTLPRVTGDASSGTVPGAARVIDLRSGRPSPAPASAFVVPAGLHRGEVRNSHRDPPQWLAPSRRRQS